MRRHRIAAALAVAASGLVAVPAAAQTIDAAAAEALFEEARRLAEEGRYAEACPKFAESNRLDPGVGVLMYLGACHERMGRVASAWAAFREARHGAELQGRADRVATATERIAALEPRLPRLRIVVGPDASIAGLEVKRDDVILGEAMWSTPVPVDPGAHAIAAQAPGYEPWEGAIEAKEGQVVSIEIPPLRLARSPIAGAAPSAGPTPPADAPPPRATSAGDAGSGQRTAAAITWGVGGASLVAGAVFGLVAASQWSSAQDHCRTGSNPLRCDQEGLDGIESTEASGLASTLFFTIGGVAAAAGTVLWITAPVGDDATAGVGIDARGAHAFGSF